MDYTACFIHLQKILDANTAELEKAMTGCLGCAARWRSFKKMLIFNNTQRDENWKFFARDRADLIKIKRMDKYYSG